MRSKSPTAKTATVRLGESVRHLFSQHWRQRSTTPQRRTAKKISSRNLAAKVMGENEVEHVGVGVSGGAGEVCKDSAKLKCKQTEMPSSWGNPLPSYPASATGGLQAGLVLIVGDNHFFLEN